MEMTKKEEKKSDLEQLLNSLIKKGWRPFNKDIREFFTLNEFTCSYRGEGTNHLGTIRAIVSKESGLWQFVCENRLQPTNKSGGWDYSDGYTGWTCMAYEYRLIESALCDEDKLEEFLLSNIKVGNEQL